MAVSVKVGTFATGTGTTTVEINDVGFQPNAVLVFSVYRGVAGSGSADFNFAGGFSASNGDLGISAHGEDAAATTDTSAGRHTTASVVALAQDATLAWDGEAQITLTADGFDVTISNAFSTDVTYIYLALGGDVSDAAVATGTVPASTGVESGSISGLSFQPKAALFLMAPASAAGTSTTATALFMLGCSTGPSNNWVVCGRSGDAAAATDSLGYGFSGECIALGNATGTVIRARVDSFDADGLNLNWLEVAAAGSQYVAICLGGAAAFLAGTFNSRTDATQTAVATSGVNPKAVLLASAMRAGSTQDTTTDDAAISVGVATSSTARYAVAATDDDAADPSECWTDYRTDAVYIRGDFADAEAGLMDIAELGAGIGQFEFIMDDTDPDAAAVFYLAIGDPGGVTPIIYEFAVG